jgi:hypothetical protein
MSQNLPQFVLQTPDYDPTNPDHVRRWELAGRPDMNQLDADGNHWRPTITAELQSDGQTYLPILLPESAPVGDVERTKGVVQERLDKREFLRTGVRPDPKGAIPQSRAWAAGAMLVGSWRYPSEADLATSQNQAILAAIYADPESKTTADSTTEQKQKALHYMLVMLEGQAFGIQYQAQLGAYERTASSAIRTAIQADTRDWLSLPCGPYETVRAMFLALLK